MVKFLTSDKKVFIVETKEVRLSLVIAAMMDSLGIDINDNENTVPVKNVTGDVLEKVLEWCKLHQNNMKPDEKKAACVATPWEHEFLRENDGMVIELMAAANYLEIPGLLKSTSEYMANMMKGMTTEELRERFGIPNDLPSQRTCN